MEIDRLGAEFNNEALPKVTNVYKWLANNKFYHNFMMEHYAGLIDRT